MRVIAGEYRGMRLVGPKNNEIRPTMDRAKEGLFNVINQDVYQTKFLDLFAGSGAIGIEALSRGANTVVFVEQDREAIKLIKENTKKIIKELQIIRNDVISFLNTTNIQFDYIFLDPPYNFEYEKINEIIQKIIEKKILSKDGQIIVEWQTKKELQFPNSKTIKFKKYGISGFTFIKEENE